MKDNDIVILAALIVLLIMTLGGQLGIQFTGGGDLAGAMQFSGDQPDTLNFFSWCWQGISFFFLIISFQVQDCPALISIIYIILVILMPGFVLVKWVRGGGNT